MKHVAHARRLVRRSGKSDPDPPGRLGLGGTWCKRGSAPGTFGEEMAGAEVPPFRSGFPPFAARSSKVQCNGKSGRSCSPS